MYISSNFCQRPGWWTIEEAEKAIKEGLASSMMLEISPEDLLLQAEKNEFLTLCLSEHMWIVSAFIKSTA